MGLSKILELFVVHFHRLYSSTTSRDHLLGICGDEVSGWKDFMQMLPKVLAVPDEGSPWWETHSAHVLLLLMEILLFYLLLIHKIDEMQRTLQ